MSTFGVLISNRSFFPDHLVLTAREKLLRCLDDMGHRVITLSTEDTFMGQTMTREEAKKCAALFRSHGDSRLSAQLWGGDRHRRRHRRQRPKYPGAGSSLQR